MPWLTPGGWLYAGLKFTILRATVILERGVRSANSLALAMLGEREIQ